MNSKKKILHVMLFVVNVIDNIVVIIFIYQLLSNKNQIYVN